MIAGRLNQRVLLLQPIKTVDGFGAETLTYGEYAKVHAEVQWKNGASSVSASEFFSDGRIEILIRDAHPVTDKWRVNYQDTVYLISAIEVNRIRGFKRLICDKVNE